MVTVELDYETETLYTKWFSKRSKSSMRMPFSISTSDTVRIGVESETDLK